MSADIPERNSSIREQALLAEFGEVCTAAEVARILKYPTLQSLHRAHARERAPIRLLRLNGRRGLFAFTREIARYLDEQASACRDAQLR